MFQRISGFTATRRGRFDGPLRALGLAMLLASPGCQGAGAPGPDLGIVKVVREATEAIIDGDEERFLRAHVQKGDMTPGEGNWITTGFGGRVPDEAWNQEIRAAFRKARADLDRVAGPSTGLAFQEIRRLDKVEGVVYGADHFMTVEAVVAGGGATYLFG